MNAVNGKLSLLARAFSRACWRAGSSIEARMAMMAITTNSSINVKPIAFLTDLFIFAICFSSVML